MKRWISWLLVCCILISALPVTALAAGTVASGTCGDNLTWVLDEEGTLTISDSGDMYDDAEAFGTPWNNVFGDPSEYLADKMIYVIVQAFLSLRGLRGTVCPA